MEARQLLFLYEMVQTGSVRAAAEKLDMNPSSVSRGISELEANLGMQLLVRHGRGSQVTGAGAVIVDHFHAELKRRDELRGRLEAMRAFQAGEVSIAMGEGYVGPFMDEVYPKFRAAYPGLSLRVQTGGTTEIVRLLADGEVQVGIAMNPPRHPRLRSVLTLGRPIRLVVPSDHALAHLGRTVTLDEIAPHPIAAKFGTHGMQQAVDRAEAEAGVHLDVVLRTSSTTAVQRFVLGGGGGAFMSSHDVGSMALPEGLRVVAVDHPAFESAETHVLVRTTEEPSTPTRHLLKLTTTNLRTIDRS